MLIKRILAGVLCAVILAGGIRYGVTFRFFDRALSPKVQEELKESIALPENFALAAAADSTDAAKNSLQAVRQAAKSGAHALELNVSFNAKNVPFLADSPDSITSESVSLEAALQANAENDTMRYLLNIRNIAPSQKLMELLKKRELVNRVILCGFTTESIRENRANYAGFKLCIDLDEANINLKNADNCRKLIFRCINAGAAYIRCTADAVTPELSKTLRSSTVKLIIDDVHTDYEMYYALSLNPKVIVTDRPAELYTILYANEYLRSGMSNPF